MLGGGVFRILGNFNAICGGYKDLKPCLSFILSFFLSLQATASAADPSGTRRIGVRMHLREIMPGRGQLARVLTYLRVIIQALLED